MAILKNTQVPGYWMDSFKIFSLYKIIRTILLSSPLWYRYLGLQIIQNIRRHISMVNPKCFVYFLFKIKAVVRECWEKIISNCFRQESIDAVSAFVLQEAVEVVGVAPPGGGVRVGSVHYLLICLCRGQVISRHNHPAQAGWLQPPKLGYLSLLWVQSINCLEEIYLYTTSDIISKV